MKVFEQQVVEIEISKLVAHPKNANVMSAAIRKKLRRHIEKTGRYEALVVRRHPTLKEYFELINGHHRKLVLEELGVERAMCVVWELDDAETLMLLATVNRLGGEDAPGKRLELLEALSEEMEVEKMADYLPEEEDVLKEALAMDDDLPIEEAPDIGEMEEAFTVFLKADEKARLVNALRREGENPARVLMGWVYERETFQSR